MNEEDLRVKRTRKAINDAFIKVLEQKSFSKITINDITSEAVICRNTFYLHYEDKVDLLNSLYDQYLNELKLCFYRHPLQTVTEDEEALLEFLRQFIRVLYSQRDFAILTISDPELPSLKERVKDLYMDTVFEFIDRDKCAKKIVLQLECVSSCVVNASFYAMSHAGFTNQDAMDVVSQIVMRIGLTHLTIV